MKIKVREITEGCKFEFIDKGEWADLRAARDLHLNAPEVGTLIGNSKREIKLDCDCIELGIAMQLPKGYEAHIVPRSSTFKKFGIIQANHMGIVDSTYCGNDDEWKMPLIPLMDCNIKKGDRICQFRIELSQKATIWQKIKWLFTRKITFVWVDKLEGDNRGGFGSTGVK